MFWQLTYGKFFATQTSMIENVSTYEVDGEKVFTLNVLYCWDVVFKDMMQPKTLKAT